VKNIVCENYLKSEKLFKNKTQKDYKVLKNFNKLPSLQKFFFQKFNG
jgi:hypothetical protein